MIRFSGGRLLAPVAALTALAAISAPGQAQQVAVGLDLAAPVAPLGAITVPDVNMLGILDGRGPTAGAADWVAVFGGPITNRDQRIALQQLGKALFWDMQVGGDGIQACATCHYHAGADNRIKNQLSPGLKKTVGGPDVPASDADTEHDLLGPNALLTVAEFLPGNGAGAGGVPVNEAALQGLGWQPDDVNGDTGVPGLTDASGADVNDVVSSQGIRLGTYHGIANPHNRAEVATLAEEDPGFEADLGSFTTVRRVEPRNSPTSLNAVYHMRNFWDGRADMFFNGVSPLGFRDPDARVLTYSSGALGTAKLRIPFSSLASQAVGPIGSDFEMVFAGRPSRDLGKKLLAAGVVPLDGQAVSSSDSLLGGSLANGRGLTKSYDTFIKEVFHQRFWGNGTGGDVCLDYVSDLELPEQVDCQVDDGAGAMVPNPSADYTLKEWNFALFFGLAVQAYEATLTTEETIVDLLAGGIATGIVRQVRVARTTTTRREVNVGQPIAAGQPGGLPLDACIARVAINNSAAEQAIATQLCTQHYSQFIHTGARAGSEANLTATPVAPGTSIGGCSPASRNAVTLRTVARNGQVTTTTPCNPATLAAARNSLLAIGRGMGRFFAGATGCAICHFNPEFTGATVAALTGFGAVPPPPLPPGQLRREALEVPMERMIAFNGAAAVYDAGFYNLGVRPTSEDLSLGDQIGGVPLAFTKLAELIQAGPATAPAPYDGDKIAAIAAELAGNQLLIPTSVANLAPRPWTLQLACGPGLVGGGDANNNPNQNCVPNVIPGERLLRNGAFKAQGLRNVKFTGPYLHNGAKLSLRQVVQFYETAGHFPTLNFNNLDAGMRIFALGDTDEAALIEFMETGLTDWRLAYEEGKFDHPEICVPHGHDSSTGITQLAGIPAVGKEGNAVPLSTFEDIVRANGTPANGVAHNLGDACTMTDPIGTDVPPAPPAP